MITVVVSLKGVGSSSASLGFVPRFRLGRHFIKLITDVNNLPWNKHVGMLIVYIALQQYYVHVKPQAQAFKIGEAGEGRGLAPPEIVFHRVLA